MAKEGLTSLTETLMTVDSPGSASYRYRSRPVPSHLDRERFCPEAKLCFSVAQLLLVTSSACQLLYTIDTNSPRWT